MTMKDLTDAQKREIFLALVEAQDGGQGIAVSHKAIAERFELSANQLRLIENEGVEKGWPPLD